jgi:hypothetical protein
MGPTACENGRKAKHPAAGNLTEPVARSSPPSTTD